MGSGAREPKRQRLAPSSSASSATASPPWAEGMEYFVPPQVWTDQYSFNFELDKSDQQRPLEPASSSPLQYGPVNAPVSMRPDAWEHPQEQHAVSVMEDVAQDQPPTPEIPAHELSDSSTYSFRAKQRSFAQDLKPTPAFDTSYAAPPCSFDISHQTMAPSTLIDSKTLDSNKTSKVPILPAFEDSPPTVPSRLPASKLASAPTSEKKNEKPPSAEQTPMSSYLRRPLPKKQKTKASQACDQCRQLKTKCDENQPCKSCKEKGLDCRFCDPMPKPTDKTQAAILDGVVALQKSLTQFQSEVQVLRDRVSSLERTITAFAQTDIGDQAKSRRWMLEFMYGILSPQPPPTYWGFPAQAFSSEVPQQVYPGSSQASSTCRMAEANRDYEQPWHSMSPGRAASPKF